MILYSFKSYSGCVGPCIRKTWVISVMQRLALNAGRWDGYRTETMVDGRSARNGISGAHPSPRSDLSEDQAGTRPTTGFVVDARGCYTSGNLFIGTRSFEGWRGRRRHSTIPWSGLDAAPRQRNRALHAGLDSIVSLWERFRENHRLIVGV